MSSNNEPTKKSTNLSSASEKASPEFIKRVCDELKDWVSKGHCQLAEGNHILPVKKPN